MRTRLRTMLAMQDIKELGSCNDLGRKSPSIGLHCLGFWIWGPTNGSSYSSGGFRSMASSTFLGQQGLTKSPTPQKYEKNRGFPGKTYECGTKSLQTVRKIIFSPAKPRKSGPKQKQETDPPFWSIIWATFESNRGLQTRDTQ